MTGQTGNAVESKPRPASSLTLLVLTALALLAFAGNSVLCRLALSDRSGAAAMDAASFTLIRLGSGALVLLLLT
ncbi:hypothetical protein [Motiliproteus sp. SC1-56]|uniref:hypothetical protein n=1 Tax=Motiliproteus sp. SC1-56 TaxID=2799565 RepID=UPI00351C1811